MPKFMLWIGVIFLVAGLAMLGGAGWAESDARRFEATAVSATGTVIDLARRTSRDDGRTSYSYAPVVEWFDPAGTRQEFVGSVASSPPPYERGERVAVLYQRDKPGRARIADFGNRYFMSLILGGLGSVFSLVGGGMLFAFLRNRRRIDYLQTAGMPIQAKFLESYRDTTISVNGRHPWRVAAQATHPSTGKLCRFESGPVWVDPGPLLAGRSIRVLLDPHDPESHFVDLSDCVDPADMA